MPLSSSLSCAITSTFTFSSRQHYTYFTVFVRHKTGCPSKVIPYVPPTPVLPPAPHVAPQSPAKPGMSPVIIGLIAIGMLLIGLFAGAFVGLWLNSKFGWFGANQRQAMAYSQFELDDDI